MIEAIPEERRHQRIHAGHNCWVMPEEDRYVHPRRIENFCLVGTLDEICQRLHEYMAAGLDEIIILPAFAPRYNVIGRLGAELLPALRRAV